MNDIIDLKKGRDGKYEMDEEAYRQRRAQHPNPYRHFRRRGFVPRPQHPVFQFFDGFDIGLTLIERLIQFRGQLR